MRGSWRVRLVAGLLAVVAVYLALALVGDAARVREAVQEASPQAMALALACAGAALGVRALRWRLYLGRMAAPVAFAPGLLMGLAGGKGGQLVKAFYLQRTSAVPYHVSLPATLGERMSDLAALVLLLVVGLALAPGVDLRAPALALVVLAVFAWALRSEALVARVLQWAQRRRRLARHVERAREAHGHLRAHMSFAAIAPPALMGLSAFGFEALALQTTAFAFGVPLAWGEAALLLALVNLAGVVSLVPGGVGAAEGSLVLLLVARAVPLPVAAATTLVFRALTLWVGVLVGLGVAAALERARRSDGRAKA